MHRTVRRRVEESYASNGTHLDRVARAVVERLSQGVIGVSKETTVRWANAAADRIFREVDGLTVDDGLLRASNVASTVRLRHAVSTACDSPHRIGDLSVLLPRPSMRRPYSAVVVPISEAFQGSQDRGQVRVLVIVGDPERASPAPARLLAQHYALTRAEGDVASCIALGMSVNDAGAELGIAPNTVRTHLKRVYFKTGTGRQSELVSLLVGRLGSILESPA